MFAMNFRSIEKIILWLFKVTMDLICVKCYHILCWQGHLL